MRTYIDNYCIMARSRVTGKIYYCTGYKTLPTMRKKYNFIIQKLQGKEHDPIMLVARDYDRNIIKIYESEEGI